MLGLKGSTGQFYIPKMWSWKSKKNDLRPKLDSLPNLPKQQVQAPPLPEPKSAVRHHSPRVLASHGASGAQSVGSQQRHWDLLACRWQRLDLLTVNSTQKEEKGKAYYLHRRTGPGGRGGLQPSQILGNSDFLGSTRKFWQSQFLKTSACFYYYFEEMNICYFNLKSA